MTDQQFVIELEGDQRAVVNADDATWLQEKLRTEPGSTRIRVRYDEDDTEGHAALGPRLRVIALGDDDEAEGHSIALNFPTRAEADAFRRRLLVTGVLAGTIALGAAGGIGLANLSSDNAGSATTVQSTVSGSDWTQAERPGTAVRDNVGGSAWSQDERPGSAVSDSAGSAADDAVPQQGGPQPR